MAQCTARQQYSNRQCIREALVGRSKCASHGSGGVRTSVGRAAIAAARSKGLNESQAARRAYRIAIRQLYLLSGYLGLTWRGRPPSFNTWHPARRVRCAA